MPDNKSSIVPNVPLLITSKFGTFLNEKNLSNQMEKAVRGKQNAGFVNGAFEAMMKSVGWTGGQAWCAYYVKIVLMQMYSFDRDWIVKNFSAKAASNFKTVKALNNRGDMRYVAISTGAPQIGDVFVQENTDGSGKGHTGMVLSIVNGNVCKTIEGNTNLGGSREGEGVYSLTRDLTIGSVSKGSQPKRLVGYIRRNFTTEELNKLNYDENNQTFVFV
jgi:hypothetical protein